MKNDTMTNLVAERHKVTIYVDTVKFKYSDVATQNIILAMLNLDGVSIIKIEEVDYEQYT